MSRTAKVVLAVSAAAAAGICGGALGAAAEGAPGDGANAGGRDKPARIVAPVTFEPVAHPGAQGVARLSAAQGRRAGIIAVLIGLTADPPGGAFHLAAGAAPCDQPASDAGSVRRFGPALEVSPDGTAVVDGGLWDDTDIVRALRHARSLSIVGDWDGDGRDDLAACGDLRPLRVVQNPRAADALLYSTADAGTRPERSGEPVAACTTCGDGKLLGDVLALRGRSPNGSVAVTGLAPDTGHVIGVSDRSCDAAGGQPGLEPAGRFTTDSTGSAVTDLIIDPFGGSVASLVVAEAGPDGPEAAICRDTAASYVAMR